MKSQTLYTIGYTKKSARTFFSALKSSKISLLLDIRLNNTSQLAGYTKKEDLEYFLETICSCSYKHLPQFAPTKEILDNYHNKRIAWLDYEKQFNALLGNRQPITVLDINHIDHACLLCAEPTPEYCHRRLVAEYINEAISGITIQHL